MYIECAMHCIVSEKGHYGGYEDMISATMSLFHETIPLPDDECAAIAIGDKWAETAAMTLQDPDKELESGRKAARSLG